MKSSRSEYIPIMDATVVGVTGSEDLLRWLTELKNTNELGAAVRAPANSGRLRNGKRRSFVAALEGEVKQGENGVVRVSGVHIYMCEMRFVLRIMWSEHNRHALG
jgi:hypothetical protein